MHHELRILPRNFQPVLDGSKPSVQHVEQLAEALVVQAKELRDCGPEEWESVSDMIEGALNNIRFDMQGAS